ncbi:hypothetical protein CAY60_016335 [Shouchella clausii]|jgi:hypothetical protein|uniref:Uncharacterized protein n=1 Tax=Shouchella clausii (strain KSM-K16) TaxID=66692 RepID=Q5WBD4_SHOC1|nr:MULTISPECIES: hypothetical protein [Shouchella]MCM3311136.1 hypothetical protein [Psychrobacillus sp. MER TA 17]KKI85219.1 hypothetical protein WZ76_17370 [Shouchella clausii]MBU3231225.1 hypothetical protein [Shouchella clausii]MBU3263771.1 hypothetical protein [Shouchella clausii]MBU3508267.1 hypothetical protein [Shouchella clausii]
MKYEITFKENERGLEVEVPQVISSVAILLMGDVQSNSQPWLNLIHKVLSGESIYEECTGNNCTLEISQDITKILDNYSEEEDECVIETKELVKIIELWTKKINSTVE